MKRPTNWMAHCKSKLQYTYSIVQEQDSVLEARHTNEMSLLLP